MLDKKIKILIVDDHQLVIEGFLSLLKGIENLDITTTNSCDDALSILKRNRKDSPFHIIFTDLSFTNSGTSFIDSGESLIDAIKREKIPVKIGVITGHSETNRIHNVVHNLNPLAYILKEKCTTEDITFAIQKMLRDEVYYTHEVHQKLLKRALIAIQMDHVAIQILKELPNHSKISNLEGIVKKSDGSIVKLRSIENKLAKLRQDLQANNNTDLILKAKELGIVD